MLGKILCRAAAHARVGSVSFANSAEEKGREYVREDLRRFDTLPPAEHMANYADGGNGGGGESVAELSAKMERLRAELDARTAVDGEAWRVQQAVQRQEEADSMKMLALLREQEEGFATELGEVKAEVEAAVLRRMREEQEAVEAEYIRAIEACNEQHEAAMVAAMAEAEAERRAAVAAGVEEAELRAKAEMDEALATERTTMNQKLGAMGMEVSALAAVLSHDSHYKRTSHATHQLSAAVLAVEESLTRRSMVPRCSRFCLARGEGSRGQSRGVCLGLELCLFELASPYQLAPVSAPKFCVPCPRSPPHSKTSCSSRPQPLSPARALIATRR